MGALGCTQRTRGRRRVGSALEWQGGRGGAGMRKKREKDERERKKREKEERENTREWETRV